MTNLPPGMTAATLLPGEYFSPYHRDLFEPPECPVCNAPMAIVEDSRTDFEARCERTTPCEDCDGKGEAPALCTWHEKATLTTLGGETFSTREPDGRCKLCLCYGIQPGIYDETCEVCDGEGEIRCAGRIVSSAY